MVVDIFHEPIITHEPIRCRFSVITPDRSTGAKPASTLRLTLGQTDRECQFGQFFVLVLALPEYFVRRRQRHATLKLQELVVIATCLDFDLLFISQFLNFSCFFYEYLIGASAAIGAIPTDRHPSSLAAYPATAGQVFFYL